MPDPNYAVANLILRSRGVIARYAADQPPSGEGYYLNESNLEEIEENAVASRLGTTILNKQGGIAYPIGASDAVHSLSKLSGLSGSDWRYAGVDNLLYRLTGEAPGVYQLIASQLSGQPWTSACFQGPASSYPYLFIADAAKMLKDNGSQTQNSGILQPKYPVQAQAQQPDEIILDEFQISSYAISGFTSFTPNDPLAIAITAAAITTPGIQNIPLTTSTTTYTTGGETTTLSSSTPGNHTQFSSSTAPYPNVAMSSEDIVTFSMSVSASAIFVGGYGGAAVFWYWSINGGATWNQFYSTGFGASGTFGPTVANGSASGMTNLSQLIFAVKVYITVGAGAGITATGTFGTVSSQIVYVVGTQLSIYESLVIDSGAGAETLLVLQVTPTGFIADVQHTHAAGVSVTEYVASGTIGASTTATMMQSFSGIPIAAWPTTLQQEDYIGLQIYVSDPNAIQSITLQFNTANGAYFYRTIGQGPLQPTLNPSTNSSTAAADAVLASSLGLYTSGDGGITGLSTVGGWTPILLQLSDFSGAGGADFNDPVMNWANVNGYQITIVTGAGIASTAFPVTFQAGSLVLVGGAGPDSFAGVSYDYLISLFNINDYTESNPCVSMTSVNPPFLTNWVTPRRQPVLLSWINSNVDTQATHWRVYRRGGTLGDNYRRIDQIPITAVTGGTQTYTDIWSDLDIQQADTVSFENDVPVTSTLPVPVNTTLNIQIGTPNVAVNAVQTITPASMNNISVNQQVDIGNVAAANFEVVIVLTAGVSSFTAFVQNYHAAGEPVSATAAYAQPLDIIAVAYDQGWYAGDTNNPSYLYYSAKSNIQAVSSAAYVPVSVPSDAITAIVNSRGNLFVSTIMRWWAIAPGSQVGASPTVYPTAADKGCVGKNAWCLREGVVYFLAVDGPRIFTGGASQLISEIVQFVWQGIGPTPIVQADPNYFYNARVAYWNQFILFAYRGLDGLQHRLVLDVEQKRWRNDEIDAQSMFLEEDTNTLVYGDSHGLVHLDRQNVAYDEGVASISDVVQNPIAITLQTPYGDQGHPEVQKQYAEFTGDFNTNGIPVTATLLFNDGQFSEVLGTITTTQRQRVNLNLNGGAGYQAYKASLQLTGAGVERIYLYQAKLKYLELAMTRQSLDTYWMRFGTDESKICKQAYFEYNAAAAISGALYYDGSSTPFFTFTLPQYSGVRNALRVRFPAVKFRLMRCILTTTADCQIWMESNFEVKPLCQGKGYQKFPMMT